METAEEILERTRKSRLEEMGYPRETRGFQSRMAEYFGVSRQRIHQILRELDYQGLDTDP